MTIMTSKIGVSGGTVGASVFGALYGLVSVGAMLVFESDVVFLLTYDNEI